MVQMERGHVKLLLTLRRLLPSPLINHYNSLITVMIDKDRKRAAGADLGFISKGSSLNDS